jgi:hypothetical protein
MEEDEDSSAQSRSKAAYTSENQHGYASANDDE